MGIILRRSVKSVIITYIAFAFGYINTLILFPLALSKEQIGLVRILINVSFLFAAIASMGAANIPIRYFPYFDNKEKRHSGFLPFLLGIGIIGYVIFVAAFILLKENIIQYYSANSPMLISYYYLVIPFTGIALFSNIFEAYIVIQGKPVIPNMIKELMSRLFTSVSVLLLIFGLVQFNSFLNIVILGYLLCLLMLVFYVKRSNVLFLKPDLSILKSEYLKGMLTFGGFAVLGNATGTIIANIDNLMLASIKGLADTGVYTIAFFIATIIEIPRRAISQAAIPLISESNKIGDINKLDELYKKSSLNQLISGILIFLMIWLNIDNIFAILPRGESFIAGKWVVFWIGASKLFDLATGINGEILVTSKYYKLDLLFYAILGVLGIVTNLLLIPKYGLTGAAIASALSIFLFNLIRSIFVYAVFKIQPFTVNNLKVFIPVLISILLCYFLPVSGSAIVDLALKSLLITIVFAGSVFLLNISEDLNKILYKIIDVIKTRSL